MVMAVCVVGGGQGCGMVAMPLLFFLSVSVHKQRLQTVPDLTAMRVLTHSMNMKVMRVVGP
jgi:hypothetical protein